MRATRLGERTAVEAGGNGFAAAAAPTITDETTTGSPSCEDAIEDDVPLMATLEMGAEDTTMEERAAAKLLLVCLAVMMARMKEIDEATELQHTERTETREKAVQTYGSVLKTNCTTSHGWNTQHVRFKKPRMSHQGA